MICAQRLDQRKKIKNELDETIRKIRKEKGLWLIKMLYYSSMFYIKADKGFHGLFYKEGWSKIFRYELKNLNTYYSALYTPKAPKNLIDMLLLQKNRLEGYIIKDL